MKNLAYLRVSTAQQNVCSQRLAILEYAREHGFQIDRFIEAKALGRASKKHRRLDDLMNELTKGDRLDVSELSRLGRSLGEIIELLDAISKGASSSPSAPGKAWPKPEPRGRSSGARRARSGRHNLTDGRTRSRSCWTLGSPRALSRRSPGSPDPGPNFVGCKNEFLIHRVLAVCESSGKSA